MTNHALDRHVLSQFWSALGGAADATDVVTFHGPELTLPSVYHVSAFASGAVAAATLAVAELAVARTGGGQLPPVAIGRVHAAAAFASERLLRALDWQQPELWDPLAGDYACRDGFIRLHTNYAHHRAAVLRVLVVPEQRDAVASAVAAWDGEALEAAIVAADGCSAFMRSPAAWAQHAQGRALASEPLVALDGQPCAGFDVAAEHRLLGGVRVLDLTRVIAGPVCTRVLAGWGADVLRIDPPDFAEHAPLLCDVTGGKRRAALDLHEPAGRARFEGLLAEAHVLVSGYRSDALARLGYDRARLRALNPNAVLISHDAYGWTGPWATRRGFDSLVQMSCGIAWRGGEVVAADGGGQAPRPLPVQALDHATGYLLAAGVCRGLTRWISERRSSSVQLSLARVARALMELGDDGDIHAPKLAPSAYEASFELADTQFGRVRRVRCPGSIAGFTAAWTRAPGALGCDDARW